jgi:hypothetical protein
VRAERSLHAAQRIVLWKQRYSWPLARNAAKPFKIREHFGDTLGQIPYGVDPTAVPK